MKIVSLKKEQLSVFEGLDPLEIRKAEGVKPNIMLGAVNDRDDMPVPVGLLLGRSEKKSMNLYWLFVDPASRRKSYAERLLSEAFSKARDNGLEKLKVTFPKKYGYEAICRNDREFFLEHGFKESKDGELYAPISTYVEETDYEGLSFDDEANALDLLLEGFDGEDDDDDEADDYISAYDDEATYDKLHKPWATRDVSLGKFVSSPGVKNLVATLKTSKVKNEVGSIGFLTFPEFSEGIALCESNSHTGMLNSLYDTPPDYYDFDVSSYTMDRGGHVSGICLTHYNAREKRIIVELFFATGNDNNISLIQLMEYSILAAARKYPPETTVTLPYEEASRIKLVDKLFG